MINRQIFYTEIKKAGLFNKLTQATVNAIESVFNLWELQQLTDLRWLAYMFGTVYHETDKTMQAITEYGKGKGRKYGKKLKRSGVPYTIPDQIYYGRGKVMITWYENYELMGRLLNIDLLNNPDEALNDAVANLIMFEGMLKGSSSFGDFTGKCLEMYFNDKPETPTAWIDARRIINGTDRAEHIAEIAKTFYRCLLQANK